MCTPTIPIRVCSRNTHSSWGHLHCLRCIHVVLQHIFITRNFLMIPMCTKICKLSVFGLTVPLFSKCTVMLQPWQIIMWWEIKLDPIIPFISHKLTQITPSLCQNIPQQHCHYRQFIKNINWTKHPNACHLLCCDTWVQRNFNTFNKQHFELKYVLLH